MGGTKLTQASSSIQGHILLVPLRSALVSVVPARRVMEAPVLLVVEPYVDAYDAECVEAGVDDGPAEPFRVGRGSVSSSSSSSFRSFASTSSFSLGFELFRVAIDAIDADEVGRLSLPWFND